MRTTRNCAALFTGDSSSAAQAERRRAVLQRTAALAGCGLLRQVVCSPADKVRAAAEEHRVSQDLRGDHLLLLVATYGVSLHQPHLLQQRHPQTLPHVAMGCTTIT